VGDGAEVAQVMQIELGHDPGSFLRFYATNYAIH
jgi:hypothetical protein